MWHRTGVGIALRKFDCSKVIQYSLEPSHGRVNIFSLRSTAICTLGGVALPKTANPVPSISKLPKADAFLRAFLMTRINAAHCYVTESKRLPNFPSWTAMIANKCTLIGGQPRIAVDRVPGNVRVLVMCQEIEPFANSKSADRSLAYPAARNLLQYNGRNHSARSALRVNPKNERIPATAAIADAAYNAALYLRMAF